MKKVLVMFLVLALATAALAQGGSPSGAQGASPDPGQSVNVPANQKIIKDDAEYNAYMAALKTQAPMARAQAMEAFNAQYPQSIMKIDALEQTMAAYQQVTAAFHQAGNQPKEAEATSKVLATAYKILEINPNHVSALTVVTLIERSRATDLPKAAKLRAVAEKGLQLLPAWQKPDGMSDADFEKSKAQMAEIFEGAAGFGALQASDYTAARTYYTKSTQLDPNNLQDIYQLAITDLKMNPIDVKGLWYIAKAVNLAGNVDGQKEISDYGQSAYTRYHGGGDGWDKVLADAATRTAIPADFTVKAAPTECEIAADAVKQNPADKLSVSDWEFVLSHRDCSADAGAAAKQVWAAIESNQKNGDAKVKMPGVKVIAATKGSIEAALTEDNQQANTADVHIVMAKPMIKPPAPGTSIDIIGVFTAYTPSPFMFTMEKGELPAAIKPKPAVHHAAAARKRVG
jgi:hypothetical protein